MRVYTHTHIGVCLYICLCMLTHQWKMDRNERDRKEELGLFVIIKYTHYLWNGIVFFESGFGLVEMYIENSRATTKKVEKEIQPIC